MSESRAAIFADLHCHSLYSDGVDRADEVARKAAAAGLKAVALTDHDTTEGWDEFSESARSCGVEPIPGIEVSATHGREVHVLGLFIDPRDAAIRVYAKSRRDARGARVRRICARLAELGMRVDGNEIVAKAGCNAGRPHVARALVAAGHASSVSQAFQKWLGDGRPAYVEYERIAAVDAIAMIRSAGGLASLAHPGLTDVDRHMAGLVAAGLGAIEAYHADHTGATAARYVRLAATLGVCVTGGSDRHGDESPGRHVFGSAGLIADDFRQLVARR
ncbi:MAG: PHP domain-containing protein [Deltaproteobacteria bacterium]|nr:PHP domain-containing protein [Deltaproteobacteria bacterium]